MKKILQGSLPLLVLLFLVLQLHFTGYAQKISGTAMSTTSILSTASAALISVPPVITCPANMIVGNGKDICGAYVTYVATATGSAVITYSIPSGNYFPLGTVNVTATATNLLGSSSGTFAVTVIDNQPPICTPPLGVTINTGASILPANTFMATGSDNCSAVVFTYTDDIALGNCPGIITRTWKATDGSNNFSTATQIITVVDKQAPTIILLANKTINLDANGSAIMPDYRTLLIASDNCTPANLLVITQTPAAGSVVSAAGNQTVIFTVADAYGNISNSTIILTKKDVTPPVISSISPVMVNNTATSCGVVVNYAMPTSVDNCVNLAFTNFSAGQPDNNKGGGPDEDYIRFYYNGNWNDLRGDYALQYIIEINTANYPIPASYTLIGTFGGHTYFKSSIAKTWVDAHTAAQAVGGDLASINTLAENQFLQPSGGDVWVGGYHDHAAADYATPGNATQNFGGWKWVDGTNMGVIPIVVVQTAGLASGKEFPVGITTNTFSATDASGNVATSGFTVTVTDITLPVITVPAAITVSYGASLLPLNTGAATATNKCNASIIITYSDDITPGFCGGIVTRTWKATAGINISTAKQTITVSAATLPAMKALDPITVVCGGLPASGSLLFSNGLSGISLINGNSGNSTFSTIPTAAGGIVTETWTATDACTRVLAPVFRLITVSPAGLPTMTAPVNVTVDCGNIPSTSTIPYSNLLNSICLISGTSNTSTQTTAPLACGGTITETWTAMDVYQRVVASVSRTITVKPAMLPAMTAPAAITVACGGLPKSSTITFSNGLSGSCLISGTSSPSTFSTAPATAAGGTVTETWTAIDACGRVLAPVSRIITVSAATLPTMTVPSDIKVDAGSVPTPTTISFSNGGSGSCVISGISDLSTFSVLSAINHTIIETWTATDIAKRTVVPVSRTITVTTGPKTVPVMWTPAGYTITCGNVPSPSTLTYSNYLSGYSLISGTSNPSTFTGTPGVTGGTITETWTATDNYGRALAPVSRILIVSAATLPVMKAPADLSVAICGMPTLSTIRFSNYSDGNCLINGNSNPSTFTIQPNTNGKIIIETWTSKDYSGRTIVPVFRTITIIDATVVIMVAPDGYTVSCGGIPAPSRISFSNFSIGSCLVSGKSELSTLSKIPDFKGGNVIETWIAKDNNGKAIATVSRTLIVSAPNLPVMKAPAAITIAYEAVQVPVSIVYSNFSDGSCLLTGASDLSKLSAKVGINGGTITETWTATDKAGRTIAPVSRLITVKAALPLLVPVSKSADPSATLKSKLALSAEDKLSVYPNPARGIINLKVTGDVSKITLVEITDILGKVIYSSKHYQSIINLSNHIAGTYFIRVNNNSKITTTKVVMIK